MNKFAAGSLRAVTAHRIKWILLGRSAVEQIWQKASLTQCLRRNVSTIALWSLVLFLCAMSKIKFSISVIIHSAASQKQTCHLMRPYAICITSHCCAYYTAAAPVAESVASWASRPKNRVEAKNTQYALRVNASYRPKCSSNGLRYIYKYENHHTPKELPRCNTMSDLTYKFGPYDMKLHTTKSVEGCNVLLRPVGFPLGARNEVYELNDDTGLFTQTLYFSLNARHVGQLVRLSLTDICCANENDGWYRSCYRRKNC